MQKLNPKFKNLTLKFKKLALGSEIEPWIQILNFGFKNWTSGSKIELWLFKNWTLNSNIDSLAQNFKLLRLKFINKVWSKIFVVLVLN